MRTFAATLDKIGPQQGSHADWGRSQAAAEADQGRRLRSSSNGRDARWRPSVLATPTLDAARRSTRSPSVTTSLPLIAAERRRRRVEHQPQPPGEHQRLALASDREGRRGGAVVRREDHGDPMGGARYRDRCDAQGVPAPQRQQRDRQTGSREQGRRARAAAWSAPTTSCRIKNLLDPDEEPNTRVTGTPITGIARDTLQKLREELRNSLLRGRSIDWDLLEPLLRVPHTRKDYHPPRVRFARHARGRASSRRTGRKRRRKRR